MATEIELKLALPEAQQKLLARHALLGDHAESLGTTRLRNIYFDTPELALQRRGIALRLRRQGRRWLQTVKCAGRSTGGLSERPEWEQPYNGSSFEFRAIDSPELRRFLSRNRILDTLAPVFETTFTRRHWRICPSPGAAIVVALDRGAITSGERSEPISEIELELERGGANDLFDVARKLSAEFALKPESLSKAERGYRLSNGAPSLPVKARGSPLRAEDTPRAAFHRIALACVAQIQANEVGAVHSDDPEYIHQMRVALRRLRSALRVFSPVIKPHVTKPLRAHLRELTQVLGRARDWDVVIDDVLAPVARAFPDDARLARLSASATARRGEARAAARAALTHPYYGGTLLELMAALHEVRHTATKRGELDLRAFARQRLRRLQRRVARAARRSAGLEVSALHALRIAVKRLRYAIEFFAPLYRAPAVQRDLRRLARLQQDLGSINDLANAGPHLERCAGDEAALREAIALVGGWYGPRYSELLSRVPRDVRGLFKAKPAWRQ